MARLTQIRRPGDFEDWNTLDWAFDREERPLNSQDIGSRYRPVPGRPSRLRPPRRQR